MCDVRSSRLAKISLDGRFAVCEDWLVRIIKPSRLREAYEGHSEWKASLLAWKKVVEQANWNNSNDVKQTFANFTTVGKYSRFEISHNRCRLMAEINYRTHLVFIRAIVTHKEYDLRNWEEE